MLHSPEEIVRLSNAAHAAEGILLLILGGIVASQGFGYLRKAWQRYLIPFVGLLASLALAGFLFLDHYNELGAAWQAINQDMQQKQHWYMGTLLGLGSIIEFIAIKRNAKLLRLALPAAVAIIGVLFLVHPQHGSSDGAARALLIHRVVGTSLLIGALAQALTVIRSKYPKWLPIITASAFILSGGLFLGYREPLVNHGGMNSSTQSHSTYSLNLTSGKSYEVNQPTELSFSIQNQDGRLQKDFDVVHEKKMHLIVVRKDRTNFQHVHPTLEQGSGKFTLESFRFPADGDYRVFADFTPSDAQKDQLGMKLPATPYQDVQVGDKSKYSPQPLNENKLASNEGGFETSIFFPPDHNSDAPAAVYYTGQDNNIVISVNKNGQPYKNLQKYLGALGHMVVLGEDLEFIHAHPQTVDEKSQGGVIIFNVYFTEPGRYKLFLQTQAEDQVTTNDFAVSVMPLTDQPNTTGSPAHTGH